MHFGHARAATDDPNLDRQAAGCTKIFEDGITGAPRKRLGLARALGGCAVYDVPIAHLTPALSPRKRAERELGG